MQNGVHPILQGVSGVPSEALGRGKRRNVIILVLPASEYPRRQPSRLGHKGRSDLSARVLRSKDAPLGYRDADGSLLGLNSPPMLARPYPRKLDSEEKYCSGVVSP